ncbi:Uncharacterised protein [Klebsiella pneumoniae]|nr:Uncharacterised protein [Klebsiella pneumoniae]
MCHGIIIDIKFGGFLQPVVIIVLHDTHRNLFIR